MCEGSYGAVESLHGDVILFSKHAKGGDAETIEPDIEADLGPSAEPGLSTGAWWDGMAFIYFVPWTHHCTHEVGVVIIKRFRVLIYVLWRVVRCGGRGCLSGPMLRHLFPVRDQTHWYSIE